MRSVQHKKEAYWFYRFLSLFYDHYVNPFFWTERMRQQALALARLDRADLWTIDVGSGTGFTTQGIVQQVETHQVTCLDQSPHQMAQAQRKPDLQGCRFQLGDAENLPYPTDHFDRYISAGSIEYWPAPQRGIAEAYRVLKPGGVALVIGPLRPHHWLGRVLADLWMLFPTENDYRTWFQTAGFRDIETRYVAPLWVEREPYGIALAGTKPLPGTSPVALEATILEERNEPLSLGRACLLIGRLLAGSVAGSLFIPMAVMGCIRRRGRHLLGRTVVAEHEPLTPQQTTTLLALVGLVLLALLWGMAL